MFAPDLLPWHTSDKQNEHVYTGAGIGNFGLNGRRKGQENLGLTFLECRKGAKYGIDVINAKRRAKRAARTEEQIAADKVKEEENTTKGTDAEVKKNDTNLKRKHPTKTAPKTRSG
ncbi:hypothetical protein N7540_001990 [Penicillium herquei]|nr:hypothetical protein N7540_001990 [Penicillium herquei]